VRFIRRKKMAIKAEYVDGVEVDERIFKILSKFSPSGVFDVFASDQHNSYLKLGESFFKHIGKPKPATDDDVKNICLRFAKNLGGISTAALFNHLAYLTPGFKQTLGEKILLIGRIEDTNTINLDGGKGQVTKLSVQPEDIAEKVDGFKILVKLNPAHKESWDKNLAFAKDIFERAQKLGKPLFTETLLFQGPGESKKDFAKRLPEGVVKMARDFGPVGHFYKTQVPLLWIEEEGKVINISSPDVVRDSAAEMTKITPRPILLLSAAVDFEQYVAQYSIVSDIISGPMCGRAYFKEAFTDPDTKDWDTLEKSFVKIAIPRIKIIKKLAQSMSKPWWHKFSEISDEAKSLLKPFARESTSVKADFGY
jgi:tagatose-1,6-bisphosphate aldolase